MTEDNDLDKMLDKLLEGKSPEEILGEQGLVKGLTKRLVERALEAELSNHLGYEKNSPAGRNTGNSRNGKSSKRVKTGSGELDIVVPRDRDASFEPQLVKKGQRRLPGFDDKVIALYARGEKAEEQEEEKTKTGRLHGILDTTNGVGRPKSLRDLKDTLIHDVRFCEASVWTTLLE